MGNKIKFENGTRYFIDGNGQKVVTGSSMGRAQYGGDKPETKVRLFYVRLRDGYDDQGAYWGEPRNLYCATNCAEYRKFVRANSRKEAAEKLGLTNYDLISKIRSEK